MKHQGIATLRQDETIGTANCKAGEQMPYRWIAINDQEEKDDDPSQFEVHVCGKWITHPSIAFNF